jgi:four helix bundle protein
MGLLSYSHETKHCRRKIIGFCCPYRELTRYLKKHKVEALLINQLLRSGTSIAANVQEAIVAISKNEFSAKISISLKEAKETSFWLKVLFDTKTISQKEYESVANDCLELEKILFPILKTARINKR